MTGLFRYFYKPLISVHRFYIWRRSLMYHTLLFLKSTLHFICYGHWCDTYFDFFFLWMFYFSQFLIAIRTLFASIFSLVIENCKTRGVISCIGEHRCWPAPAAYQQSECVLKITWIIDLRTSRLFHRIFIIIFISYEGKWTNLCIHLINLLQ